MSSIKFITDNSISAGRWGISFCSNFALGAALQSLATPLVVGSISRSSLERTVTDSYQLLVSSPPQGMCAYYQQGLSEFSKAVGQTLSLKNKFKILDELVLTPTILEELIHRGLIQDLLLKRFVGKCVKWICPKNAGFIDSKIYTGIRIFLSTLPFALVHLANVGSLNNSYVMGQVYSSLIYGITFGILKEWKGMGAVMGAHAANNLIGTLPFFLLKC